jgi:hypothetical protein
MTYVGRVDQGVTETEIDDIERRIAALVEQRARAVQRLKADQEFTRALKNWPGKGGVDQSTGLPSVLRRGMP